jgi:hypothetical protein
MLPEEYYMSEVRDSNIETIYIPLLDEGLPVVRPTKGTKIGTTEFLVLATPDYDPETEHWEFPPGSIVQCVKEYRDGDEILVARELTH